MQDGRKPVEDLDMEREEYLRRYGHVSGKPIKYPQEMFLSNTNTDEETNPKFVLVTGKAGIGKTLFCQKLIQDWADDKLFQSQTSPRIPNFKFTYLLTFHQLNLLGKDHVSMKEILNQSSMLDVHSSIDETLFEYMVDHPEEVLIIIDGYDEHSQQDFIASDLDDQYPNNPHEEMPVAALCAKLIKGKLLRGSSVLITSRPDESDKIEGGQINFDRYFEITGFSAQQVKEYVGKYFRETEEMKNAVMDHITKNDNLVSLARISVLCFLMCSYFEYILENSTNTDALPVNSSDIYFEVIDMFLN
ncbi:protein NLRC5-like [Stylophora pistillata]|uniref:protein NLRC5-like n=1 Tax=Stylophora pistillata TaxID=50429 RepID=UPI000C053259|nr:protein NLRC5-like [Stylophora pistillata]